MVFLGASSTVPVVDENQATAPEIKRFLKSEGLEPVSVRRITGFDAEDFWSIYVRARSGDFRGGLYTPESQVRRDAIAAAVQSEFGGDVAHYVISMIPARPPSTTSTMKAIRNAALAERRRMIAAWPSPIRRIHRRLEQRLKALTPIDQSTGRPAGERDPRKLGEARGLLDVLPQFQLTMDGYGRRLREASENVADDIRRHGIRESLDYLGLSPDDHRTLEGRRLVAILEAEAEFGKLARKEFRRAHK